MLKLRGFFSQDRLDKAKLEKSCIVWSIDTTNPVFPLKAIFDGRSLVLRTNPEYPIDPLFTLLCNGREVTNYDAYETLPRAWRLPPDELVDKELDEALKEQHPTPPAV